MRTLVLGGARSGKSSFAEGLAGTGPVLYVATARPWADDPEFAERIAHHVQRRPAHWVTEDQIDAVDVLRRQHPGTVLIDDIGTWLTHTTDVAGPEAWENSDGRVTMMMDRLVDAVRGFTGGDLVLVTPEVGMGIVPAHPAGRMFRDRIGTLNQQLADVCDRVVLVVAGQTLELKAD